MKIAAALALIAGAAIVNATPARADMVDMSTITCAQLATMNEEEGSFFLIWLDGWLAGQSDETTLDVDTLSEQIDGIAAKCEETPELSVINAAKQYLDEE